SDYNSKTDSNQAANYWFHNDLLIMFSLTSYYLPCFFIPSYAKIHDSELKENCYVMIQCSQIEYRKDYHMLC
ncbi:MAG: hypothetical protein RR705_07045, partial [Lachnospiraceae bacterium]